MDRYPEREVVLRGDYCMAQVLTPWRDLPPRRYIAVNSLDGRRPGEWVAEQRMGAWMNADLRHVVDVANHAKAMSDALLTVAPLGGSELFVRVGGEYLADPRVLTGRIAELRESAVAANLEVARLRKLLTDAGKAEG